MTATLQASSMAAAIAQTRPGSSNTHPSPDASLLSPHHPVPLHQLPSSAQHNSHHLTSFYPQQPVSQFHQTPHQPGLHRGLSSEAESQAEGQVYSLRSRSAPRVPTDPPSFHQSPSGQHSVHDFFMCHNKVGQCPIVRAHVCDSHLDHLQAQSWSSSCSLVIATSCFSWHACLLSPRT